MDKSGGFIQTKPRLVGTGLMTLAKTTQLATIEPSGVVQVYDQGFVRVTYTLVAKGNKTTLGSLERARMEIQREIGGSAHPAKFGQRQRS